MTQDTIDIAVRLGAALTAGSLIGLERSIHGRPAGFRTHALVCLASALLMLVTAYQWEWLGVTAANEESFRTDPTRINMQTLAEKLRTMPAILEFRIAPTGD